jgi:hypothetical protein
MNCRAAATLPFLVLALAAGLAGCQDSGVNTIKAERDAVENVQRTNSDRPAQSSKGRRMGPDTNDLSPKLQRRETK